MWCWLILSLLSAASIGAVLGACRLMEPACCKDRARQTSSGAEPENHASRALSWPAVALFRLGATW
jgi:hypothetical protein